MENFVTGTCLSMCSNEEMNLRENERLLHKLEMVKGTEKAMKPKADPKKIVKCFTRSAADMKMALPHRLRPFSVLYDTVHYLLTEVVCSHEVSTLSVYHFVWDRLRAVRQDMTIQALSPAQSALLLEPMVRFHVLFGYKLCELPQSEYDAVINKKQLLDCLKHLLVCYDEIDLTDQAPSNANLAELCQLNLKFNKRKALTCDRHLMESLYIICNLDDIHPLLRYLKLSNLYRCGVVRLSYEIAVASVRGNYVRVCRLAKRLPSLAFCMFSLLLPLIQRRALAVMSHAYNSKHLSCPRGVLARWLLFNSGEEAERACAHYGLTSKAGEVLFNKSHFKSDARTLQPTKVLFIKEPGVDSFIMN